MTERRFTLDDEENGLCRCILVDGEEMPTCEICELLNELNDENEKLIQKKCLSCELVNLQTREIDKLKKENEHQKEEIVNSHKAYVECLNQIKDLKKENKQLKKAEKINVEYAEQIVEENKKLRIAKNDLRIENEQLKQKLENIGLNEKNDSIKMIDGKVFIRM